MEKKGKEPEEEVEYPSQSKRRRNNYEGSNGEETSSVSASISDSEINETDISEGVEGDDEMKIKKFEAKNKIENDEHGVLNLEDINNLEEDDRIDEEGRRKNNKKWKDGKEGEEISSEINSSDEEEGVEISALCDFLLGNDDNNNNYNEMKATRLIKDLLSDHQKKHSKKNEIDKVEEEENKKIKDKMLQAILLNLIGVDLEKQKKKRLKEEKKRKERNDLNEGKEENDENERIKEEEVDESSEGIYDGEKDVEENKITIDKMNASRLLKDLLLDCKRNQRNKRLMKKIILQMKKKKKKKLTKEKKIKNFNHF
jgi:hypothetical protein